MPELHFKGKEYVFKFENVTKHGDLELVIDEHTTVGCDLIFEDKWKADLSKILDADHD